MTRCAGMTDCEPGILQGRSMTCPTRGVAIDQSFSIPSRSRRTARSSVWYDAFCDKRKPIIINFVNGRRIYGWPLYYSDTPESPYIFLFEPAWIENEKVIELDISGILITPEQKIESIEFLRD